MLISSREPDPRPRDAPTGAGRFSATTFKVDIAEWRTWWKHFGFPELRHLLLVWWDPIGVYGEAAAIDEYDDYVFQLGRMLRDGASEADVRSYLRDVSSTQMEIVTPTADHRAAEKVVEWYSQVLDQWSVWQSID